MQWRSYDSGEQIVRLDAPAGQWLRGLNCIEIRQIVTADGLVICHEIMEEDGRVLRVYGATQAEVEYAMA